MGEIGWTCPRCGTFNVGTNRCRKCGYEVLPTTPKSLKTDSS